MSIYDDVADGAGAGAGAEASDGSSIVVPEWDTAEKPTMQAQGSGGIEGKTRVVLFGKAVDMKTAQYGGAYVASTKADRLSCTLYFHLQKLARARTHTHTHTNINAHAEGSFSSGTVSHH